MEITPNIKVFSKKFKSKKYNRFCLWTEISADLETPITAYLKLVKKENNNFLLESVEGGSRRGRYSIIGIESDKLLKCTELNKNTFRANLSINESADDVINFMFLNKKKIKKFNYWIKKCKNLKRMIIRFLLLQLS